MALSSVLSTLLVLACVEATIAQTLTVYTSANADCQLADKALEGTFNPVPTDFMQCNSATTTAAYDGTAIKVQVVSTVTEVKFSYWTGAACSGAAVGSITFTPAEATTKLYVGVCAPGVAGDGSKMQMIMKGVPASAWDKNKAAGGATTTQGVATATTQGANSTATATATTQGVATATTQGVATATTQVVATATTQGANSTTATAGVTSTAGVTPPAVVASGAAQTSLAFLLIWAFAAVL